ncbi:hypothetical protein EMIHUDRAFT_225331 [Emiliania huxleyi CCMP1516]|uniref:Serine-threonine/tyrosine-protein kinase catalytic domain-containing protein n=2 Tax=Emiliania huxleyi TaxID=2903 RepID=A0A0D3KP00_EMIH1|nr:hypothetical protein EMIHUDRAFT_225331 [Emiliania huxleyi CCMP1516]EOD37485.1 hypothetical protein EMIHUDRAFT_225331 [Emiliania huxleyi CCMP1516]|eukprot:XP_005789914.1 hypothetical protein EMIHUDRAFT_225331 [Emiliania huxleyi CCMP1516]
MSVLFFLLLLYALYIASIPFRVSTTLKPAQQLNRSLSRRSIISLTHFARCPLSPLPPVWAAVAALAGRASFHPAKSFLSHSMCSSLFIMRAVASSLSWKDPPLHRSRRRLGHDLQVPRDPGAKVPPALLREVIYQCWQHPPDGWG